MDLYMNNSKLEILREIYIETDKLGLIKFISPNCKSILGFEVEHLLNKNIICLIDLPNSEFLLVKSGNFKTNISDIKNNILSFDIIFKSIFDDMGNLIESSISLIDITKYNQIEEDSNIIMKMIKRAKKDIIYKYQVIPELKFTYLSDSVEEVLGFSAEDFNNDPTWPFQMYHPDDKEIQFSKINSKTDFSKVFQVRFKHKDGHYVWLEDYIIPTYNEEFEVIAIEGIARSIQERKELEDQLKKLSYTDGLTGLYNRTYLNKQINLLKEKSDVSVAIIACDLDDFKYINDTFGHCEGDSLLKNVSALLNNIFTNNSIVVRSGGDEFIIVITDISLDEAQKIHSQMLLLIDRYNEESNKIPIKLSTGFSYSSNSGNILDQINKADKNMYKNKFKNKQGTTS